MFNEEVADCSFHRNIVKEKNMSKDKMYKKPYVEKDKLKLLFFTHKKKEAYRKHITFYGKKQAKKKQYSELIAI